METNDFDRSDFDELSEYMERFRKVVGDVQEKTDVFCNSFVSGISKVREGLAKVSFTGLDGFLGKAEEKFSRLNVLAGKTGELLKEKVAGGGEAVVNGLASVSEMVYSVMDTMNALPRIRHLKITTNADENKAALEGIVGTGGRMKRLFDELEGNPLLKSTGLQKSMLGKMRSGWEVLNRSKEDIAGLMTISGKGMKEADDFRGGWRAIRNNKDHSLKGFGSSVKAVFKKREKTPEEGNSRNGFFSIFRKKDEGDKNWFTAVAGRLGEFKERTKNSLTERLTPLVSYGTRIAGAYSPLAGMAGNALNVTKLSGQLAGQAGMTWLKAARGWGIGDKDQNELAMGKISRGGEAWEMKFRDKLQKGEGWKERIFGAVGKVNHLMGMEYDPPGEKTTGKPVSLHEGMSAPGLGGDGNSLFGGGPSANAVTVNVGRLVENLTIESPNLTEGVEEMRNVVINELSRILNNANNLVMQ